MLKWQPEPELIQIGTVQCENNLDFLQHDDQGDGEKATKIYKKSHATRAVSWDIKAGHALSRKMNRKSWRKREAIQTTSCRECTTSPRGCPTCTLVTMRTRATRKKVTNPPTFLITTPIQIQEHVSTRSPIIRITKTDSSTHTGSSWKIKAGYTCSETTH